MSVTPHATPLPSAPSSIVPSQSSSTPLQDSVAGSTLPTQTTAPAWHCVTPNAQGAMLLAPQAVPMFVGESSIAPSQSSSLPLHVSSCWFSTRIAAPMQTSLPPWHSVVPACGAVAHSPSGSP